MEKFSAIRTEHQEHTPEEALAFAVLVDAVELITDRRCRGAERRETAAWFRDDGCRPYSFEWCCQHLQLEDSERIRRRLLGRWRGRPPIRLPARRVPLSFGGLGKLAGRFDNRLSP